LMGALCCITCIFRLLLWSNHRNSCFIT